MASYVYSGFKWGAPTFGTSGGTVQWSFFTRNYEDQEFSFERRLPANFQAEVRDAFERWEQVARIDFVEVADASNVDIRLGFDTIDGLGETLAEASTAYDGRSATSAEIRFETDEGWRTSGGRIVTDTGESFYATALHEIGHTIGLDHYDGSPAVMNTFGDPSITDLLPPDIIGIQAIYGTTAGDPDVDVIEGTSRANTLAGTSGHDFIKGLGGNDTLKGLSGEDHLLGGSGKDKLDGGNGRDLLRGGTGRDALAGGSGSDVLLGGDGNDRLNGGGGDDILVGGKGRDALNGGSGIDVAVYSGDSSDYDIALDENGDLRVGSETLTQVEFVIFLGDESVLDVEAGDFTDTLDHLPREEYADTVQLWSTYLDSAIEDAFQL